MKLRNRYIFSLLLLSGFVVQQAKGQVFPPDFDCMLSDTLFWQPTPNTCGPFLSTEVYISNTPTGPFTLLTTITDPTVDQFFHMNNTGEDRYYYLRHVYDCPGETILNSDTLSNLPIVDAVISFITVQNDAVQVIWNFSSSPQVNGYIIYRITAQGSMPIDTVSALANNLTDLVAMPSDAPVGYFVVGLDPCGNTSNFNNKHETIFLKGGASDCDEQIEIEWTPYIGWSDPVQSYDIYVSAAGVTPQKVGTAAGTDSVFLVDNISSGIEYCIFIEAISSGSNLSSRSNTFCVTPDIVDPVDVLQIENISVRSDNTIELTWYWETDIEINSFEFRRGSQSDQLSTSFSGLPGILVGNNTTRIDPTSDGSLGKTFYGITTIDDCGREFSSNIGSSIFLTGTPTEIPLQNALNWTALDIDGATLLEYHLWRLTPTGSEEVVLLDNQSQSHFDFADANEPSQAEICYYVTADFSILQPDGTLVTNTAKSNQICVRQPSGILVPNAFSPGGVNTQFKPLILFDEGIEFDMKIFNRWGAMIFETDNYLLGWDGRNGLQEMPMGGYLYSITVVQPDGEVQTKEGAFLLIR